jgi:hypothetical protein
LAIFPQAFFKRIEDLFLQLDVKRVDTVFERYDDISNKYLESTLRSKGKKKNKNRIISNDNTEIQSNYNNFFSKIENKLQLVQFLYSTAPRYEIINEDCENLMFQQNVLNDMALYFLKYLN